MSLTPWAQFGSTILSGLGSASAAVLAANPNFVSDAVAAAISANNPQQASEDTALAQAESIWAINPTQGKAFIDKAIGLIPPAYISISAALSKIAVDTPYFTVIQALDTARAKLKLSPGS